MKGRDAMFRQILVAYDGSHQSQEAFRHAVEIARRFEAGLHVVSVIRLPEPAGRVEVQALVEEGEQHFAAELKKLADLAAAEGLTITSETVVGHPAEHLVAVAEQRQADLIVMGRRGKTGVQRWMLGSVSERVLRYAHCPVLVVR